MDSYDRNIICIENYIKEVICDSELTIDGKVDLIIETCRKEHDRELKEALEQNCLSNLKGYGIVLNEFQWNKFWKERGIE